MKKIVNNIIAHRGESQLAPENTIKAFNLAWENGVKAIEADIHLTADNKIIVIHDANTKRTCGVKLNVKDHDYATLEALNAANYLGNPGTFEKIPLLTDVLKTIPADGKILIEIKSDKNILPFLKGILKQAQLDFYQVEIIAFNFDLLKEAKKLMPGINMLWLLDLDYSKPWWMVHKNPNKIARKVLNAGLNGVDVWAGKILNDEFIQTLQQHGLLVYCWTVDNIEHAQKLLMSGIDGITTNRAGWMIQQLL